MGRIVKRRKKGGRQSDSHPPLNSPESDYRRSLRRRNARPIIDYDDYLDEYEEEMMLADEEEEDDKDEDEDEDEDEDVKRSRRKKKKKLQSVVKLVRESDSAPIRTRREVRWALDDDDDDGDDYEAEARDDLERENDEEDNEEGRLEGESKREESDPGTPIETQNVVPLPDKKLLELILDKLQKKDIYGVYAEPVDPEELPDYFDIIKHPMDFATVRKKLANGKYSTLDQIEKDVFLICSNAMQYNERDTIYYKQAHTIQEMARKKFEKLRTDFERSEKHINTDERNKSNNIRVNPVKRSIYQSSQEPVRSDFVSGAVLSTPGDSKNGLTLPRIGSSRNPFSNDSLVERNASTMENGVDKVDDFVLGKNVSCKLGKKPLLLDENRRGTYNISNQLNVASDSIFTTFQKEPKELVSVGLQAEHSYARSLARFAGALEPVAWNIAAKNIKEALSQSVKFGRGWVGEYEPLSTPFLKVESQCNMGSAFPTALPDIRHLNTKVDQKSKAAGPFNFNSCYSNKDRPVNEPVLEGRPSFIPVSDAHPTRRKPPSIGNDGRGPVTPVNSVNAGRNPFSRNHLNVGAKVGIQDVGFASTANTDKISFSSAMQLPKNSFVVPSHGASQPPPKTTPFKMAEFSGIGAVPTANASVSTFEKSRLAGISSNDVSSPAVRSTVPSGFGQEHQGVSDPVHLMRMLAEKAHNQQNSMAHSPVSSSPAMPSVPSLRRYHINNGSQVSPRSWMSLGPNNVNKAEAESPRPYRSHIYVDSLYNPACDVQQVSRFRGETPGYVGLHFQMEKNHLPNQTYGRENHWFANEAQLQGHSVNMTKMVTTDLSRFQVQSPRQSLNSQPQTRQNLPPDLNIGFRSSGSPARQGTQVDPQQPDLALQL